MNNSKSEVCQRLREQILIMTARLLQNLFVLQSEIANGRTQNC